MGYTGLYKTHLMWRSCVFSIAFRDRLGAAQQGDSIWKLHGMSTVRHYTAVYGIPHYLFYLSIFFLSDTEWHRQTSRLGYRRLLAIYIKLHECLDWWFWSVLVGWNADCSMQKLRLDAQVWDILHRCLSAALWLVLSPHIQMVLGLVPSLVVRPRAELRIEANSKKEKKGRTWSSKAWEYFI